MPKTDATPQPGPKRPWGSRLRRALAWTVVGLVLLGTVLYVTRRHTLAPLAVSVARRMLDERFDSDLLVREISGSWFGDITLSGVQLSRRDGDFPIERIEDLDVVAEYTLWGLLRGRGDWLKRVDLTVERLELDLSQPGSPQADEPATEPGPPARLPARLPEISIGIGSASVRLPEGRVVAFRRAELRSEPASKGERIELDVQQLSVELPGQARREGELRLTATYKARAIEGLNLSARSGATVISASGLDVDLSTLDATRIVMSARGAIEAATTDVPQLVGRAPDAGARALPEHSVRVALDVAGGRLVLRNARIETVGGSLQSRRGELVLGRTAAELVRGATLDVDLDATFGDLTPLGELFGEPSLKGSLEGSVRVKGPLLDPRGELALEGQNIFVAGRELGTVSASAELEDGVLTAKSLEARTEVLRIEATGGLRLAALELLPSHVEATVADVSTLGDLGLDSGSAHLSAELSGPLNGPTGEVGLVLSGVIAGGRPLGSLEVRGVLAGTALERMTLKLSGPEGELDAGIAVRVDPATGAVDVALNDLSIRRGDQGLELVEPGQLSIDGSRNVAVDELVLAGALGRIALSASKANETTTVGLSFDHVDLQPLLEPFLPAGVLVSDIDGTVQLSLAPESVGAHVELSVAKVRLGAQLPSVAVRLKAAWEAERLTLTHLDALRGDRTVLRVSGSMPLTPGGETPFGPGDVRLDLSAELRELGAWIGDESFRPTGAARLKGELGGTWEALRGRVRLDVDALRLTAKGTRGERSLGPGAFTCEADVGDAIRLTELELVLSDGLRVSGSGAIDAPLSVTSLARDGAAALRDAPLAVQASLEAPDLAWLSQWTDGLRRVGGRFSGEVNLGGTLGAPSPRAKVEIADGEVRASGSTPPVRALSGHATFEEGVVRLDEIRGELGAAPFLLSGTVSVGEAAPQLDATLTGKNLLLMRSNGVKVRADVDVKVTGPLERMLAKGDVVITDGRFVKSIDLLGGSVGGGGGPTSTGRGLDFSIAKDGPLADMRLDLAVKSAEPFVLKNNLLNGGVRPDLRVSGTGAVPILVGPVYVEPIQVFLPSGRLIVRSGTILFREDNPFVPELALNADARTKGYDITMQISGEYDEPEVELSSVPPLPGDDLVVLLLTGQLPEGSSSGAGQSVAVYLAQDFLSRWLASESTEADETFLDRLDIQTGRDVTKSGADTAEIAYRLGTRPRGPGRTDYITAERDVYDKINFGYRIVFRFR